MNNTRNAVIVFLAFVAVLFVAGCSSSYASIRTERPVAVSILIGNHACSKELNITSVPVQEAVSKAISSYGYISVINVDGDPDILIEGSCDIDERYKDAAPQKLAQDAAARTIALLSELQNAKADTPEVDTLAALRLAVRSFASVPSDAEKIIIVIDSGLSTTGLCDFTNNLLFGEPEVIAEALFEQEAIPDLTGVQVLWQQLGDVDQPQESLSPRQVNKLQAIWRSIVERGGGSFTIYDVPPSEGEPRNELPEVSPVSLEEELPIMFEPELAIEQEERLFEEPVFLMEAQVQFVPDSEALLEPETAYEIIEPIAEYMLTHPELDLLLVGTTAGDNTSEFGFSLSLGRAMTVKDVLISLGVGEDRILTRGLGGTDPWHIYNAGTQGELAAQNRKVVLIDANTEVAQEILGRST